MKIESALAKTFLALASVIIAFAALEIMSRIYLWHFASDDYFKKYASLNQLVSRYKERKLDQAYSPHRYLGFYPTPGFERELDKHNSLGFRGEEVVIEKPQGVFRIACLGGSTTHGLTDNYKESYPHMLEEVLKEKGYPNVEVINAGAGSYTSWETFISFQFRVLQLDPDLIIVYHAINDVYPRIVWPPSAYRADNSGARIPSVTSARMPSIWHYSTLIRFFLIRFGYARPHSSLDWILIERPQSWYAGQFTAQHMLNRYPEGIFQKVPASEMLDQNPPKYFESNLRSVIAIAKARKIEVVFVTFAHSPFFKDPAVSTRECRRGIAEHNEIVRSFSDEVHVFDFAKIMPVDRKYYLDGIHFTPLGNRYRAELFADYLIEKKLIE